MLKVISATSNPDKLCEISAILDSLWGNEVLILERPKDIPPTDESGATLEANAILKAKDVFNVLIHGKSPSGESLDAKYRSYLNRHYLDDDPSNATLILADDTGLSMDALDGRPGVFTARFAGENATYVENWKKLLKELDGVENRQGRFVSVIVALFLDGLELITSGTVEGSIAKEPRGERGFGYDPVFIPLEGDGRTFSEMSQEEKDLLSHRGRALNSLKEILEQMME